MPKPVYEPLCARHCVDRNGRERLATEWVHIDGTTEYVCANCARQLFNLPAESTRRRRARRAFDQETFDG